MRYFIRSSALALTFGLLLPVAARAADTVGAAGSLAEVLMRGLSVEGEPAPSPIWIQTFSSPTQPALAVSFTQALRHAVTNLGAEVLEPVTQEVATTAAAGESAVLANAARVSAKAAIWGQITCTTQTCAVSAEALDVASRTLLLSSNVTFDAPGTEAGGTIAPSSPLGNTLRTLADRIATVLQGVEADTRYQRFAVAPLTDGGRIIADKHLGAAIANELTRLLRQEHDLTMIDPADVQHLLEPLHINAADLEPHQASELGKQLGVQALALGQVNEATNQYLLSLRLVAMREGQVVAGEEAALPMDEAAVVVERAAPRPGRYAAFHRSLLVPGWGQFYTGHTGQGVLFSLSEAALLGLTIFMHVEGENNENQYHAIKSGNSPDFDKYYNAANNDYQWRNIFGAALVAVHIGNIIDSLFLD